MEFVYSYTSNAEIISLMMSYSRANTIMTTLRRR
jgi:hypothetical protein